MITTGVDLASQAAKTALCSLDWSRRPVRLTELVVGVDDATIAARLSEVDKLGIDVPLGWPTAFVAALSQHARDGSWPSDYDHGDTSSLRLRRTDLVLAAALRAGPPLSVSTDRIALPAMRAAALLSRESERVALDGSGVVVEVYPAAALRRWGFPSMGYKHEEHLAARRELINAFVQQSTAWLSLREEELALCEHSDDAFDALVAALGSRGPRPSASSRRSPRRIARRRVVRDGSRSPRGLPRAPRC